MKLAEALRLKGDYDSILLGLDSRITRNLKVQEGDIPAEDPVALISEYKQTASELKALVTRINLTNAATLFEFGKNKPVTLTEALAERQELKKVNNILDNVAKQAVVVPNQYSRTEIKTVTVVDVNSTRKEQKKVAEKLRKLDYAIQEKNFLVDLIEL